MRNRFKALKKNKLKFMLIIIKTIQNNINIDNISKL